MKNIYLLKDTSTDKVDAVIITENTTLQEVQEAIDNAKASYPDGGWQFDDLMEKLPEDCEVYGGDGYVWY